jgi:hypothetical protein
MVVFKKKTQQCIRKIKMDDPLWTFKALKAKTSIFIGKKRKLKQCSLTSHLVHKTILFWIAVVSSVFAIDQRNLINNMVSNIRDQVTVLAYMCIRVLKIVPIIHLILLFLFFNYLIIQSLMSLLGENNGMS